MNWQTQVRESYNEIKKYNILGLRSLCNDENYQIGDYARNSLDWDYENDTSSDDKLNGTSVVVIDNSFLEDADDLIRRIEEAIEFAEEYNGGERIVLLGGMSSSHGTDNGEQVIVSAMVLAIVR